MRQQVTLLVLMLILPPGFLDGRAAGAPAVYLGGTLGGLEGGRGGLLRTDDPVSLLFVTGKATLRVPYERINLLEYGQKVDRRLLEAVLISPLLILSKKRDHYLSVGFQGEDGRQQAVLWRVAKGEIRAVLVSLEARTGKRVGYMDDEARKAGKG